MLDVFLVRGGVRRPGECWNRSTSLSGDRNAYWLASGKAKHHGVEPGPPRGLTRVHRSPSRAASDAWVVRCETILSPLKMMCFPRRRRSWAEAKPRSGCAPVPFVTVFCANGRPRARCGAPAAGNGKDSRRECGPRPGQRSRIIYSYSPSRHRDAGRRSRTNAGVSKASFVTAASPSRDGASGCGC
jgi:hypothetical protein